MRKKQNHPKPAAKKTGKADPFFGVIAKVYGVPVHGISAIGNQPYLNKDGRLFLLKTLRKTDNAVRNMRTEFIAISKSIHEPAIVKKTIVFLDGTEIEAIGEASQDNVDSDNVKKTLNMVAETRALNRAIWTAIGADVMQLVEDNLASQEISTEDRERIREAGRVSYEEMERPAEPTTMNGSSKLYEATSKRIETISDDEEALRKALEKVPEMPLSAEQKDVITKKIQTALAHIVPTIVAGEDLAPGDLVTVRKGKGYNANKRKKK